MLKLANNNDPILKQCSEDWDFEKDINAKDFEIDMVQTMVVNKGRGLAANQVGIAKRVFAIQLSDQVPFCMFNPAIINTSTELSEAEEGCLSFPSLYLNIKRSKSITAEYFDRNGNKCIIELTGIDARCFQHELDHLNGICFVSKISPLKLALAIKKQRKHNGRTKR